MRAAAVLLVVAGVLTSPAHAQAVSGRTVDEAREGPVAGALVRLLDREGRERARAVTDADGRFLIEPPEPGAYYLEGTSLGYRRTLTPLLGFTDAPGTVALDLMLTPEPIGLEGLTVDVDVETRATEELRMTGLTPRDLGRRWVDRRAIEAVAVRPDLGSVLDRHAIPNVRVIRPENLLPGSDDLGLCVSLTRARTGQGQGTCALVVLNGVPITGEQALGLDPESVEAMAVLLPPEAAQLFGTRGGRGALLVWTRTGGAR